MIEHIKVPTSLQNYFEGDGRGPKNEYFVYQASLNLPLHQNLLLVEYIFGEIWNKYQPRVAKDTACKIQSCR